MRAVDSLKVDHRNIERLLMVMSRTVERLEDGDPVEPPVLEGIVEVIQEFADGYHHQKEERHLFPAIQETGLRLGIDPLDCMAHEHEYGRANAEALERSTRRFVSGEAAAMEDVLVCMRSYIGLLRHHIYVEDTVLFKTAERILDDETQAQLSAAFLAESTERADASIVLIGDLERIVEDWD